MPSLKTIRKRIGSVRSTQKITGAMKMVAGARLSRAQQRITQLRPYAVKSAEVLGHLVTSARAEASYEEAKADVDIVPIHPLLEEREEERALFIVLTSDRGLCGAFNVNVCRAVEREWKQKKAAGVEVSFLTIGKKGREYVERRGGLVMRDFLKLYDGLELSSIKVVSEWIVPRFLNREFDSVSIIYNEFKSALSQVLRVQSLLPLKQESLEEPSSLTLAQSPEYIYEPDRSSVLEHLVPMYIELTLYRALLESQASEYGSRMSAMDSATRNAKEMIEKLTLAYNRARQAAITKELMEIIGGAEALSD